MATVSYWEKTERPARHAFLQGDIEVDVAVVGGGITGITAAYLLKRAGRQVALVERDRCLHKDTAHTTAHLTYVTDMRLTELVKSFGENHAQAVWDAGNAAIHLIHEIACRENIDCDFAWTSGYLHSPVAGAKHAGASSLEEEAVLARRLEFAADFIPVVPLMERPGVKFANQAKFHPLKYAGALLSAIDGDGSFVFEESEVLEISAEPIRLKTGNGTVTCRQVVIATHVPLAGKSGALGSALFQSKLAHYTSYVVGARLPKHDAEDSLFWDTEDPYHYLRIENAAAHSYAIMGGCDHRTGQAGDSDARFLALESLLCRILPHAQLEMRWSGQVIETPDSLPFIGEATKDQFVATGFSGNGMTFGTLAGTMARDWVLGRRNPWSELFHPGRKKILVAGWNYLKENADYPYYLLKDRLAREQESTLSDIERGNGKVLRVEGKRVAAYRDDNGKLYLLSPVCTHLGCLVHWNRSERTWDCPCHGSRFQATGEVLAGPAETPLEPVDFPSQELYSGEEETPFPVFPRAL